jgi:hypothetical protein
VATQEDLLALLDANLGVAIIPDGASATNGFRRMPLMRLELARTVSVYTVAGRRRAVACATLLNLLRAADFCAPDWQMADDKYCLSMACGAAKPRCMQRL